MQPNIRHPSDRQHGLTQTDSFDSTHVDTRRHRGDVGGVHVCDRTSASTRAFSSRNGVCEDQQIVGLGPRLGVTGGFMESQLMFAPLATAHSRWKSFLVGWGLWAQIVVAVLLLNAILPKQMQEVKRYVVTNLMAPVEPVTKSVRRVNPRVAIKPAPQPAIETPAVAKLIVPRQVHETREQETELKPPDIKLTSKAPDLTRLANASIPKVIATNGFATPTEGIATNSKPAVQVQTGGFGDPQGVAVISDGKHDLRIAAKAEAGQPKAAGFGDGLGGPLGVGGVRARANGIQS
ncbi:MAG: hypothetical protein JO356_11715, partial [Acidobacteria bacterium]|nr:hypothetical protein [Acidobacteriota bacterium]